MYKVIHRETNTEIIILEPSWERQLDSLRDWGHKDLLVCQECLKPVGVRAGHVRSWHFAHKHRQDCPISYEPPHLLQARALLYRWLVNKFGTERVTLEKRMVGENLPHPVDCWVAGEPNFAYWIFEAGLRPQLRETLRMALKLPGLIAHWLFLTTMLNQTEDNNQAIHLTTTEREFMRHSDYDYPIAPSGQTLHYLDYEGDQVTTYRGLCLKHAPQVYQGEALSHPINLLLISQKTGELIHPGEYERLKKHQKDQQKKNRVVSDPAISTKLQQPSAITLPSKAVPASTVSQNLTDQSRNSSPVIFEKELGICETCGEETRDWWYYKAGKCGCRKCQKKAS